MRLLFACAVAVALVALPARGLAIEPSRTNGSELVAVGGPADGTTVRFEGEVISEALAGGAEHVWVNVLSDGVAVGVWMPEAMTDDLQVFGDWQHVGDRVAVTGVFNAACDEHGGDLDVHVTELELVARGTERERPVAWWKLGFVAAGTALALYGYRRMRRREEEWLDG